MRSACFGIRNSHLTFDQGEALIAALIRSPPRSHPQLPTFLAVQISTLRRAGFRGKRSLHYRKLLWPRRIQRVCTKDVYLPNRDPLGRPEPSSQRESLDLGLEPPSSRRESHPPALTDPDVTISRHPARIIQLNERQHQPASGQIESVNVF